MVKKLDSKPRGFWFSLTARKLGKVPSANISGRRMSREWNCSMEFIDPERMNCKINLGGI